MDQPRHQILLYYKYVAIDNPVEFAEAHLQLCQSLRLLGRIIVAREGINGTVSGTFEDTVAYMEMMRSDERFADMPFKIDMSGSHAFKRISVRVKKEIVHLGLEEDINPNTLTGIHLKPTQFHDMLLQDDVVVIDGRNDYEYEIGHFRGAIRPDVQTFREFPAWIRDRKEEFQGKKILTYCTGGIRCEKLSGLLLREGLEDVYQLDGGIVTYSKDPTVQGHLFDGKCYVFDERISVRINHTDEDVVMGFCEHCGEPSDRYRNCGNLDCHRQHICCEACESEHKGFCSKECHDVAHENLRVDPLVKHLQTTSR